MPRHSTALFVVACMTFSVAAGCGGSKSVGDVAGEVSFDGQPVAAGMISFESTDAATPPRYASIQAGHYEAPDLPPGKYLVRISAGKNVQSPPDVHSSPDLKGPEAEAVNFVPLLSHQWNVDSKLTVDVQVGKNLFDFRGDQGSEPRVETGTSGS